MLETKQLLSNIETKIVQKELVLNKKKQKISKQKSREFTGIYLQLE